MCVMCLSVRLSDNLLVLYVLSVLLMQRTIVKGMHQNHYSGKGPFVHRKLFSPLFSLLISTS